MRDIQQILMKSGLTLRQSKVYLTCLQYGQLSATSIARLTGIPRTSVYDLLSALVKLGYVTQAKKTSKGQYLAVDPHNIFLMMNEKKNVLESNMKLLYDNLDQFKSMRQFSGVIPQVQYYEGKQALEYFFQQIASASYSYSIFSLDDLLKHVYYDVENILERLSHTKVKGAKRIMSYSSKAKEYITRQVNPDIERKLLPQGYDMQAEITLFDGVLLQMSFAEQPSILEIKHPVYYKAHKTLFDFVRDSIK